MYRQCEHGFVGWHGPYGQWGFLSHARRCSKDGSIDIWFRGTEGAPVVCHVHENGLHYTRIARCVLCGEYSEWTKAHRLYERAVEEHVCYDYSRDKPRECAHGVFTLLSSPRCVCCGAASKVVSPEPWYLGPEHAAEIENMQRVAELSNGVCHACLYSRVLDPLTMTWLPRPPYARAIEAKRRNAPAFHFTGDEGETIRTHWPSGNEWRKKVVAETLTDFWIGGDLDSMKALSVALLVAAEAKKAAKALAA